MQIIKLCNHFYWGVISYKCYFMKLIVKEEETNGNLCAWVCVSTSLYPLPSLFTRSDLWHSARTLTYRKGSGKYPGKEVKGEGQI